MQIRAWWFLPTPTTTVDVPGWTNIATVRGLGGWWTEAASVDVYFGVDLRDDRASPHLASRWRWTPDWRIRPMMCGQFGWAQGQDAITLTRLGGINPYVIPLAGAAWAEFRVEDYAAVQLGPSLNFEKWNVDLLTHVAHFSGRTKFGLGPRLQLQPGRLGIEVSAGYAPTLERQRGPAISGYLLLTWSSPS